MLKVARTDYGKVLMAAVCDGMGGLARGELASATLVRMLSEWFGEDFPPMLYQGLSMDRFHISIENLVYRANDRIGNYAHAMHSDMGTTMALLLIVGNVYYVANVGDSRVYLLGNGLQQLTQDQTFIQQELREGRMTPEEAKRDPRRNVLLQCVGASPVITPDYYTGEVPPGSVFLLCSDGFRHVITPEEIYEYCNPGRMQTEDAMKESLQYLTELDKYRQEVDNISSALIRVE